MFAGLLKGGRSIVENTITELGELLDPEQFFQVNRNTIASIKAINKFSSYFNCRLILQLLPDNHEVIVSRERVHGFKEWLNKKDHGTIYFRRSTIQLIKCPASGYYLVYMV